MEVNSQVNSESIPDSPQNDSGGEVSAVVSNVRTVKIQIPVAVFTAHRGYDWSKLPDFVSRDEADSLFEKVMSVKTTYCDELLLYGDSFKGVLYEGKYAFAFRLMTAEKWDQAKRDSNYCACAFIPHDMLKDVYFERLLDMGYFKTTTHTPDCLLDYYDEDFHYPSTDEWSSTVCNFRVGNNRDFDWRLVGPILSDFGDANGKWFFARISSRGESKFIAEFGTWDEKKFVESSTERIGQGEQAHEETELDNVQRNVVVVSNEADYPSELSPVQDYETQQNIEELSKENPVEEGTAHELAKVKRDLESLQIQYNRVYDGWARERQARNAAHATAMKYKTYYHAYNDLRNSTSQKDSSINWLLLAGAFLLGVILSGVIFLTIQFSANHSDNNASRKGVVHTAVQSVEASQ